MNIFLKERVCLVTGGSRGIGRAIVRELAESGATVAFSYRTRKDQAESLLKEIEDLGGRGETYQADVTDTEQVQKMIDAIHEKLGPISVLVNNAGMGQDRTFAKMTRDKWDEVISVNLHGTFNVTKSVLPDMIQENWGRIINISSIVGQRGNFGQANYSASKAGMIGMTKTLALELASKGILVNAVAPGFIETDMTSAIPAEIIAKIQATIPIARMGTPTEVASMVVFLASQYASYITGQVFGINGGLYM